MDRGACSYRRYLEGDESAFEEIVKEFREPLTKFICGIIGDYQESEDIAIDAFAYLASKRNYDFSVSLKTYLFMLGKSRAFDHLRCRRRHALADLSTAEAYIAEGDVPENEFWKNERRSVVQRAISSLPEKMRAVVLLIYFENMSYEDAAKVMKLSKKQIDNLLYRAKSILRTIIGEENI